MPSLTRLVNVGIEPTCHTPQRSIPVIDLCDICRSSVNSRYHDALPSCKLPQTFQELTAHFLTGLLKSPWLQRVRSRYWLYYNRCSWPAEITGGEVNHLTILYGYRLGGIPHMKAKTLHSLAIKHLAKYLTPLNSTRYQAKRSSEKEN